MSQRFILETLFDAEQELQMFPPGVDFLSYRYNPNGEFVYEDPLPIGGLDAEDEFDQVLIKREVPELEMEIKEEPEVQEQREFQEPEQAAAVPVPAPASRKRSPTKKNDEDFYYFDDGDEGYERQEKKRPKKKRKLIEIKREAPEVDVKEVDVKEADVKIENLETPEIIIIDPVPQRWQTLIFDEEGNCKVFGPS